MVENLLSNAEDAGLISGQGTKIPHAATTASTHLRACSPQLESTPVSQWRPTVATHTQKKESSIGHKNKKLSEFFG